MLISRVSHESSRLISLIKIESSLPNTPDKKTAEPDPVERKAYQTDISDAEWEILQVFMPPHRLEVRPRKYDWREIVNGIYYIIKAGCSWRLLPHDLPPWWSVYHYFRKWKKDGIWEKLNDELRRSVRALEGRNEEPSAAIVDSQSVKTTESGGVRGYDAGKKNIGEKALCCR